jgi:hypothetical protein
MSGVVVTFQENRRAKREKDFGLENALAGLCRRRWPDKPIQHIAKEWTLSESEASKVFYGNASKNTLKKLLHHKRGGFALFVDLLCDACGTTLEDHIHSQAERARHERQQREAEERHWATLAARISGAGGDARRLDQSPRGRRATDAGVG